MVLRYRNNQAVTEREADCIAKAFGFTSAAAMDRFCREAELRRQVRTAYPGADPRVVATRAAELADEERAALLRSEQEVAERAARAAEKKEVQRAAGHKGVATRRANAAARELAGAES